ncbi:MAG: hypothetical protein ACT4OY_04335 [Alphaproteobacteria bacterium]
MKKNYPDEKQIIDDLSLIPKHTWLVVNGFTYYTVADEKAADIRTQYGHTDETPILITTASLERIMDVLDAWVEKKLITAEDKKDMIANLDLPETTVFSTWDFYEETNPYICPVTAAGFFP